MKIEEILLIDDDPVINFINKKVVKTEFPHHPVVILENGLKGVEYIRQNPQKFYLIFLDLNMPVMNGWQFLETITEDKNQYRLNIHILTSSIDLRDETKAKENELVLSYLTKPLKSKILTEIKLGL
ncbi:response regulator [Flexithrix dorotheae]|uniref:response regulator n=1 Tax=Flexithrix dorotheae TaxID=70993 RepID=UPI000369A6DF|nr:response regulator [Flexithrix dorotheae]